MSERRDAKPRRGFTLGLRAFDRISAVEGMARDASSRRMFDRFEATGLSAEARRQAIRDRHAANMPAAGRKGRG